MANDRVAGAYAALIILLISSAVSTALRCYSMAVIMKRFLIEDWLAVISQV